MQVFEHVELECTFCEEERPHELLYLSGFMRASRCETCGHALVFSGPLREEHTIDVMRRALRLPGRLNRELLSSPLSSLLWPAKAAIKPLQLAQEAHRLRAFEPGRGSADRPGLRRR